MAESEPVRLPEWLRDIERLALVLALCQAGGNPAAAARAVGLTPRSMEYRIKKLGINVACIKAWTE